MIRLVFLAVLCATVACGNKDPDGDNAANTVKASCFHHCVSPHPVLPDEMISSFACVGPLSPGECDTYADDHCENLAPATAIQTEAVTDCSEHCDESCRPSWFDCDAGTCSSIVVTFN